ncbi:telomere-binding alpha subunit central domain-containing protein [Paraphaeosphaeria sporulosa]
MAQPSRFLPIRDVLQCQDDSCFIGAISNIQAPNQVNKAGGDYILNFTIKDKFPGDDKDSVACILKRGNIEHLPSGAPGDVAILRGMKVEILGTPAKKTLVNCSERRSEALFFPAKSIPEPQYGQAYYVGGTSNLLCTCMLGSKPASPADQTAVINMKAAAAPLLQELQNPGAMFLASIGSNRANFKKTKRQHPLSSWTFGVFYDLIGEVVKTFWGTSDSVDLYVTDYTTNTELFLYEETTDCDVFGGGSSRKPWPGPFGQMTIAIRTYEPHAGKARELKEGDFVYLQNVRTKLSAMNKLEGAMHADPQYPEKICVRKLTHPAQLSALKERKEEYERKCATNRIAQDEPTNVPKKPSAIASHQKKLARKEKMRLHREQVQTGPQEKADAAETVVKGLNQNICTGDKDVGISTVDEIVNNPWLKTTVPETEGELLLPFVNSRYRTHLRVVDHYPFKLENFTRLTNAPANSQPSISISSDGYSQFSEHGLPPVRFAWHFFLLVEDADAPAGTTPIRFPLTIDTPRAQCLLKMEPVDLIAHPSKLCELEQKLFLLWGNLHERKLALKEKGINLPLPVGDETLALSNMPFECCVEEYGVPVNDKGLPYTDDEIKTLIKELSDPESEEGKRAVDILGNPETWKRAWSPHNTIIKGP